MLLIILLLLLVFALPTWPYSAGWGYYPSGLLGLLLIVLFVFCWPTGAAGCCGAESGRGRPRHI